MFYSISTKTTRKRLRKPPVQKAHEQVDYLQILQFVSWNQPPISSYLIDTLGSKETPTSVITLPCKKWHVTSCTCTACNILRPASSVFPLLIRYSIEPDFPDQTAWSVNHTPTLEILKASTRILSTPAVLVLFLKQLLTSPVPLRKPKLNIFSTLTCWMNYRYNIWM